MSESKTPRTDAAEFQCAVCSGESWASVRADFARTLELELNEAKVQVQEYHEASQRGCINLNALQKQLTTAQQEKHQQQMQFLELYKLMPEIENQYVDRLYCHLANYLQRYHLQQQEIAELKKDKERLDWLNNQPTDVEPDGDLLIWATPFTYPSAYSTGDETIRQAIDSAMKGTNSK